LSSVLQSASFLLQPENNEFLQSFLGWHSEHLQQIELKLGVEINVFGFEVTVLGLPDRLVKTQQVILDLYQLAQAETLSPDLVHIALQEVDKTPEQTLDAEQRLIRTRRKMIKTRNINQANYVQAIQKNAISFGIGPAGTGKTYLAVAAAVEALEQEKVRRIILTRPAVEAGEKLGFLPGDLSQKIDPYLRPLFDALYDTLGFETVDRMIEKNIIEIAPLAFMRGRTLNESFILLDEAQNTTAEQMKMLLTRIGFSSQAVITGDITQCDLPKHQKSGLRHAIEVLENVKGIGFTFFQAQDVVRHSLVQKVVQAYDLYDKKTAQQNINQSGRGH